MITLEYKKFNPLSDFIFKFWILARQSFREFWAQWYTICRQQLDLTRCHCPYCGEESELVWWGSYERKVLVQGTEDSDGNTITAKIPRVRCNHCGHTHALVPFILIPYCQMSLSDMMLLIEILEQYDTANPKEVNRKQRREKLDDFLNAFNLSENYARDLYRQYKGKWKTRTKLLASKNIVMPSLSMGMNGAEAEAAIGQMDQFVKGCFDTQFMQFMQPEYPATLQTYFTDRAVAVKNEFRSALANHTPIRKSIVALLSESIRSVNSYQPWRANPVVA